MSQRTVRIGAQIQRELTELLSRGQIKDHRIPPLLTITGVEVSGDLSHAKVYFSVFGEGQDLEEARAGLQAAAGFVHRHLGRVLKLRVVPKLQYRYDPSLAEGARMDAILSALPEIQADRATATSLGAREEALAREGAGGEDDEGQVGGDEG